MNIAIRAAWRLNGTPGPDRTDDLRIRSPLPQSFQIVSRSVSAPVAPSVSVGPFSGQLKRLFNLAKVARKWQGFRHRLAGHSAIGYCRVCRRAIYETFSEHWKRGH
jgi:hypothetical protein